MKLRCAISPDADDLFMFRAITEGLIDTEGLTFEVVSVDTDKLNRMADGSGPDVTAISIAHYPIVASNYQLLAHGGSVGRGYGPVVVAKPAMLATAGEQKMSALLEGRRIAVPGLTTTACLVLRMITRFDPIVIPIAPTSLQFDALRADEVEAALIIHEGRLTYAAEGFVQLLDIGDWWFVKTSLPLPLGGNVIRRDLGADVIARADRVMRASIAHGLAHREEAIDWLLARGGTLKTREAVDLYLSLYANADTLDYGADGREGIRELLRRGAEGGWLPVCETVDFVGDRQD
ncbi:MAG: MqnA/MqnD/SBP family protein [Myxococcota bacterium]